MTLSANSWKFSARVVVADVSCSISGCIAKRQLQFVHTLIQLRSCNFPPSLHAMQASGGPRNVRGGTEQGFRGLASKGQSLESVECGNLTTSCTKIPRSSSCLGTKPRKQQVRSIVAAGGVKGAALDATGAEARRVHGLDSVGVLRVFTQSPC